MSPLVRIVLFIILFAASFQALSCLKFEKFCSVQVPWKVHLLLFLLSLALAGMCTSGIGYLIPGGLDLV